MARIAIIGAGVAGIFAALQKHNSQNNVFLIDKNEKVGREFGQ